MSHRKDFRDVAWCPLELCRNCREHLQVTHAKEGQAGVGMACALATGALELFSKESRNRAVATCRGASGVVARYLYLTTAAVPYFSIPAPVVRPWSEYLALSETQADFLPYVSHHLLSYKVQQMLLGLSVEAGALGPFHTWYQA